MSSRNRNSTLSIMITAMVASLTLAAAPVASAAATACAASVQQDAAPMGQCSDGCCTTMDCCEPCSQNAPSPTAPAPPQRDNFQALLALTASSRPGEAVLPPEKRQVLPATDSLHRRLPDSLALLCVFLI